MPNEPMTMRELILYALDAHGYKDAVYGDSYHYLQSLCVLFQAQGDRLLDPPPRRPPDPEKVEYLRLVWDRFKLEPGFRSELIDAVAALFEEEKGAKDV